MEENHNNGPQLLINTTNPIQQQQQQLSSSSSPSHDFSFTISLQSSTIPENLSPAGDIFFHGHLLPLHLLSHLPVSPRSSTDSFTLPVKDLLPQINKNKPKTDQEIDEQSGKGRVKAKSFSLFGKSSKVKKEEEEQQKKGGAKFDVVRFLKSLVRPSFVSFSKSSGGKNRRSSGGFQSSLSGNLLVKGKKEPLRGRRGGLSSAPVTARHSPTNSGHLIASETSYITTPVVKSDSDMEELQAAISAAIAHCKKSIAATAPQE